MRKKPRPEKGLPADPVRALRARELLAEVRQLVAAENWRDAAPRSYALVQTAPDLAEAHELMGHVALKTGAAKLAEGCFERAVTSGPATASRLLNWGKALQQIGEPAAAEKILHRALLVRPGDPDILTDLGDAQLAQGNRAEALKSFQRALKKDPGHRYAAHMSSALGTIGAPDPAYVTRLFDDYAAIFEQHLTGTLGYRIPQLLAERLIARRPIGTVLDIGCGTGLVGAALSDAARAIDGIDLAPRMIEKAQASGYYRHLALGDATEVLRDHPDFAGPYDIAIAADVFIYVGAIEALLGATLARLAPDGILAFSIETSLGDDIEIRTSGRFAHAPGYIERLAAENGLEVLEAQPTPIRTEQEKPIDGMIYLLGRH